MGVVSGAEGGNENKLGPFEKHFIN